MMSKGPGRIMGLPPLLGFLLGNGIIGFALGIVCAGLIVLTNVGGLNDVLAASDVGLLGLGALFFLFGLTFASVVMGAAVMSLPKR